LAAYHLLALQRLAGNSAVAEIVAKSRSPVGGASILAQRAPVPPPKSVSPGKPRFSEREYAHWHKRHPKCELRVGGEWEPDFLYKRYTPKWFADQGYVYGLSLDWGAVAVDVWIDDGGVGREFRVQRWVGGSPGMGPASEPTPTLPPTDTPETEVTQKELAAKTKKNIRDIEKKWDELNELLEAVDALKEEDPGGQRYAQMRAKYVEARDALDDQVQDALNTLQSNASTDPKDPYRKELDAADDKLAWYATWLHQDIHQDDPPEDPGRNKQFGLD
jgi:hypothetical protein